MSDPAVRYIVGWNENDAETGYLSEEYESVEEANVALVAYLERENGGRPHQRRVVSHNEDGRLDLAFDREGRDGAYGDPMGGGFTAAWVEVVIG